jgi:hypothetical protein
MKPKTAEALRLEESHTRNIPWKKWGPYLSDRQWGTVREDYSPHGSAWDFFPHDQARSRAYRWGEDGIAGISDDQQLLCFAIALWNGEDPILKERFFGLTGNEGNHGEDVKEYYFYLDSTPTHSYLKALYKYPHQAYPYDQLVAENQRRSRQEPEFELLDTEVFNENRYFDVVVEYAKHSTEDILIQITVTNRGSESKTLHLLPTLWFRNIWSWDKDAEKPRLKVCQSDSEGAVIEAFHPSLGKRWLYCQGSSNSDRIPFHFTENETNLHRLFGVENLTPYVKDGINNAVVEGQLNCVNPQQTGTKCSADYVLSLEPNETQTIRLRLSNKPDLAPAFGSEFENTWQTRVQEANEFYQQLAPFAMSDNLRNIQRQAFAGMLWSKQYYAYSIENWLAGDPAAPPPPQKRKRGRNAQWVHFDAAEILSMPDKWEYPWFAAWDLAFHTIPLALLDPDFAKAQLDVITREWYIASQWSASCL